MESGMFRREGGGVSPEGVSSITLSRTVSRDVTVGGVYLFFDLFRFMFVLHSFAFTDVCGTVASNRRLGNNFQRHHSSCAFELE